MEGTPELYNDEELRSLWRSTFKGTQGEFCDMYGCNRGNFNAWLMGKRKTSPACAGAVRRFLAKKDEVALPVYSTQQELDSEVWSRASKLRLIVYVDGDNAGVHIDGLSFLLSSAQEEVLVIFFLSKEASNTMATEMRSKFRWFFMRQSCTVTKDATDSEIVSSAMAHHFLLFNQPDVRFLFVSRDGFIHAAKGILEERGRTCFTADGFKVHPATAVYFAVPQSISLEELKRMASGNDEVQARVACKILGWRCN